MKTSLEEADLIIGIDNIPQLGDIVVSLYDIKTEATGKISYEYGWSIPQDKFTDIQFRETVQKVASGQTDLDSVVDKAVKKYFSDKFKEQLESGNK